MASTVKVDKIEGSTGSTVEVTAGQTFKATAPIIATSILDTSSNELFKLTATSSAQNEFTVANGGSGVVIIRYPILYLNYLEYYGFDKNIFEPCIQIESYRFRMFLSTQRSIEEHHT